MAHSRNTNPHPEEHENQRPDLLLRPAIESNDANGANNNPPGPLPLPHPSFSESLPSSSTIVRALELHDTLRVRSEVETVLREVLADVEWTHTLQERAQARMRVTVLEDAIRAQQYALEETRAVDEQRQIHEAHLADQLVRDMATLSRELDELRAVEVRHKALLMQHDEVVAKLLQTEDELAQEKEHRPQALSSTSPAPQIAAASPDPPTPPPPPSSDGMNPEPPAATDGAAAVTLDTEPSLETTSHETHPQTPIESPSDSPAAPTETPSAPAPPAAAEPAAAPAVVLLLGDNDVDADAAMDPPVPKLEEFGETLLMHVFSFLDALDILNTAQVNVSMYSRVDSLFGLGGGGGSGGGGVTSSSTHDAESSSVSPPTAAATAPAIAASTASTLTTTTATSTVASVTPTPVPATPVHSPTVVKLPPPVKSVPAAASPSIGSGGGGLAQPVLPTPSTPNASTATSTTTTSSPSRGAGGGGLSLFSSILQPRGQAKPPVTPSSSGGGGAAASLIPPGVRAAGVAQSVFQTHRRTASADATATAGGPPMNAAMANSMASKLSDAELNAIILMTERLKQKESLAERLSRENDALAAQLDGAEAVKDFLISKVRDVEAALSANDEHEAKIARQIASDQEVIAFLDARVQELEGQLESDRIAHEASEVAHQRRLLQLEQKTAVLGDLLQFERERVKENEVDWRSTKRVLVKEVKGLRSQLAALSAERDGYREQNERLRLAVIGPGGGGGSFFAAGSPSKQQSMLAVRRQGSFS